jgi:hypothetical protein
MNMAESIPDGPKDRDRVNLDDPSDLRWWCKVLGVTEAELRTAVQDVGTDATEVRKHVRK